MTVEEADKLYADLRGLSLAQLFALRNLIHFLIALRVEQWIEAWLRPTKT